MAAIIAARGGADNSAGAGIASRPGDGVRVAVTGKRRAGVLPRRDKAASGVLSGSGSGALTSSGRGMASLRGDGVRIAVTARRRAEVFPRRTKAVSGVLGANGSGALTGSGRGMTSLRGAGTVRAICRLRGRLSVIISDATGDRSGIQAGIVTVAEAGGCRSGLDLGAVPGSVFTAMIGMESKGL